MEQVPWVKRQVESSRPPPEPTDDHPNRGPDGSSFVTVVRGWSLSVRVLALGLVAEVLLQMLQFTVLAGGPFSAWRRVVWSLYSLLNALALGLVVAGVVGFVVQRIIAEASVPPDPGETTTSEDADDAGGTTS